MDDSALKIALRKLLDQGEAAQDNNMMRMAAAKKAPAAAMCPECKIPLAGGKCPECGKDVETAPESPSEDEGEGLAGLLEQGGA